MPPTSVPQERDSQRLLGASATSVLASAGVCGASVLMAAAALPGPPASADGGKFKYVGEKRAILRAHVDRTSAKVGDVDPETIVTVLEYTDLDDGTRRARVDAGVAIGWMTAEKDGKLFLVGAGPGVTGPGVTGEASALYPPVTGQGGGGGCGTSVFAAAGVAPSPPKERKSSRAVVSLT